VIFIDEAQFFPDLIEGVLRISEKLGVDVYVVGLKSDWQRKPFGQILDLIAISDDVVTLKDTFCAECPKRGGMNKAIFTHRLINRTGQQIEVGNDYIPVCRKCYLSLNKPPDSITHDVLATQALKILTGNFHNIVKTIDN